MRIRKGSLFNRSCALLRCLILKTVMGAGFSSEGFFFVGGRVKMFLPKGGRLALKSEVHISDYVELQSSGYLEIGKGTTINSYSRIIAYDQIIIGARCAIAQFVTILDHDHALPETDKSIASAGYETAPVKIGSNVWVGDKVTILKGVSIGNNAVIGANSLVTSNIPAGCVAGGNPAKVIRFLEEEHEI